MKDNIELNKHLCAEMPYLIPRNVFTDMISEDYDYSYIRGDYELPEGWIDLFIQMCTDLRDPLIKANFLEKFRFSQIKEKYGSMRCYTFGCPKEVSDIISKYEYISQFICEDCGKLAKYQTQGWIGSYCQECLSEKSIDGNRCEKLQLHYSHNINEYRNGRWHRKRKGCRAIIKRYLAVHK